MDLTLNLNSRLQPMHRHDLEDALQEILEKGKLGEVTGGGTLQSPHGEIVSCDIEIHLNDDKQDSINRLVGLWRDWLFMSMERIYQMKFMGVAISITSLSRWNQQ